PTLLGTNLAADPSARDALELVGKDGGVTMTQPQPNTYQQLRMQLVAPVHRGGRFVGWVGATIDPTQLGREMLGDLAPGLRAAVQWDANGAALATAKGTGFDDAGA